MNVEDLEDELEGEAGRIYDRVRNVVVDRKTNEWLNMKPVGDTQQAGTPDTSLAAGHKVNVVSWLRKNIGITLTIGILAGVSVCSYFYEPVPAEKKVGLVTAYLANDKVDFRVATTEMNGYPETAELNLEVAFNETDSGKWKNFRGWVTITTPASSMYNILVANGTRLYLDACSSVKFFWPFGSKGRLILLETGQAGLDIHPDLGQDFTIQSKNLIATAGTAFFNFNIYNKGGETISVLTGAVSLASKGDDANRLGSIASDQEVYWPASDKKLSIHSFDREELLSWYLSGKRHFNEVTMRAISQAAQQWYGIVLVVDPGIADAMFTGYLDKRQSFTAFLDLLKKKYSIASKELTEGEVFITGRK